MKTIVHIGDKPIILVFSEFDEELDVDQVTSIDYSNIYGEAVTVSALQNKIGMLKAESEKYYQEKKLECDIYEADLKRKWRREAATSAGKFTIDGEGIKLTESALNEAVLLEKGFEIKRKNVIKAQRDVAFMDSLFWAISSKDKKLNNLIKAVTPKEFYDELVGGKINTFLIKKV
jgi:hypothetical protein